MLITTESSNHIREASQAKVIWNIIAITYTFVGYSIGIALLIYSSVGLNILGVFILTHSLLCSAFLSHEFMHSNVFRNRQSNIIFGNLMLWLNGGCYYGFKALTLQHIAHHVDRADIFTFDIPAAIAQQPYLIRQVIFILEWLYFPIVGFWSRWRGILAPWWSKNRHHERIHMTLIIIIRVSLFTLLGLVSLRALLLYFLAYLSMITVLRWADAFQHTYEAFPPGTILPKRDRTHEQAHTFSNLISHRYPWLNLLILNFGYHNAHHASMTCPWQDLPQLNRTLSQEKPINYIPFYQQLINYHKFRIIRLVKGQGEAVDESGNRDFTQLYGAVDVSFLMLY